MSYISTISFIGKHDTFFSASLVDIEYLIVLISSILINKMLISSIFTFSLALLTSHCKQIFFEVANKIKMIVQLQYALQENTISFSLLQNKLSLFFFLNVAFNVFL